MDLTGGIDKRKNMSIGLKRGKVLLEPHQDEWDAEGKKTCEKIKELLGDDIEKVEHVGSTSIRWICAKPIIDIAVSVESFDNIRKHDELLSENGIVYRKEDVPGQQLYRSGDLDNGIVTHYIHVVKADSDAWNNYINFRDYMNAHKEDALRYEELKKDLCARYPDDREAYIEGKRIFITDMLKKARIWREKEAKKA